MRMTDLEGQGGVVRLFLAHALIGEIGFVFYAGFPEALTQGDDADFAFVVRSVGECLGFGFVGFAAVAGVKPSNVAVTVAFGSGSPLKGRGL